jgi:pimeloyl-ACP methyl ester carboxylesterase
MEDLSMGNAGTSSAVQAVVDFFGPTHLDRMDRYLRQTSAGETDHLNADSPESRLLGGVPTMVPGQVIAAAPDTWVTRDCPPFFFAHAPKDPIVPVQHSIALADRIASIAGEESVILRLVEGAGHATPEFDAPDMIDAVKAFIEKTFESCSA